MAGDTRDPANPSISGSSTPKKTYETFYSSSATSPSQSSSSQPSPTPPPPPSANSLPPLSSINTAGSSSTHQTPPRLTDALKTVRIQDFKQVHMYPCVRDALLTGIAGGFVIGGVRGLGGAPIAKAANWAVGAFVLASLGSYEFCLYRRHLERAHMKRAVEIMDRKKAEKEMGMRRVREERRVERERMDREEVERRREQEESRRTGWRVW